MPPRITVAFVRRFGFALLLMVLLAKDGAAQTRPPARVSAADAAVGEPAPFDPGLRDEPRRITRPARETEAGPTTSGSARKTRAPGSLWSVTGPLTLILIAVVVGAALWRRHGPGVTPGLPREAVDPLGRRPIDAKQSLLLVRVGSRILVLASTPAGLQTLSEVTDPVEVDLLTGLCKRQSSKLDGGVTDTVRNLFGGRAASAGSRRESPVVASSPMPEDEEDSSHETAPGTTVDDQRFARSLASRVRSEGRRVA